MTKQEQHTKILSIFTSSNIKIKDINKLKEYIDFCIENDEGVRLRSDDGFSLTSHHHILPRAKTLPFDDYSVLKLNKWNGTHLTYKNHYTAHHILVYALDELSQHTAFTAMNNKDIKNGRLKEEDLIGAEEFDKLMLVRSRLHSEWAKQEVILEDGSKSTNVLEKGKKSSKTMTTPFKDEYNNETTIYEENGKKCSKTKLTNEWKANIGDFAIEKCKITKQKSVVYDDVEMTILEMTNIKHSKTKDWSARRFNIKHIDGRVIENDISYRNMREKYTRRLIHSSKEKYLGKSKVSLGTLKANNSLFLVGMYAEEIPSHKERGIPKPK